MDPRIAGSAGGGSYATATGCTSHTIKMLAKVGFVRVGWFGTAPRQCEDFLPSCKSDEQGRRGIGVGVNKTAA